MFKSPPPTIHYSFHMAIKNNIYIEYDTSRFHSVRPRFLGQAQKSDEGWPGEPSTMNL